MSLLSDAELTIRALSLRPEDLVLFRHHLEASDGIGFVIARRGGDILVVGPKSRERDLDTFLDDMREEFDVWPGEPGRHEEAFRVAL